MPKSKGPTWADAVNAPPFTLPPELVMTNDQSQTLRDAHSKAVDALREQTQRFEDALSDLKIAIDREQRANLRLMATPQDAAEWLSRVAASNRAGWSGGPNTSRNIVEALTRDTAIEALRRVRF